MLLAMLCTLSATAEPVSADDAKQPAGDRGKPQVLIIGDSISLGYTPFVIQKLNGMADVVHSKGNSQHTGTGVKKIDAWLGDKQWDLIHFNWGLWDLCYRNPEAKTQGRRDKVNGKITFTPEEYGKNLEILVERLKKTGATLVWAHTTLVPEGEAGRIVGDDKIYNDVAAKIMKQHGIAINDLHALTSTFEPELFSAPGNVHYTRAGSEKLADQVVTAIKSALATGKTSP